MSRYYAMEAPNPEVWVEFLDREPKRRLWEMVRDNPEISLGDLANVMSDGACYDYWVRQIRECEKHGILRAELETLDADTEEESVLDRWSHQYDEQVQNA